jgi:hypothetical protein
VESDCTALVRRFQEDLAADARIQRIRRRNLRRARWTSWLPSAHLRRALDHAAESHATRFQLFDNPAHGLLPSLPDLRLTVSI